jgi:hypothetical protein
MNPQGRIRSSIPLRLSANPTSKVIELLKPNDPVEILEEEGNMLKVISSRLLPPIIGYVLRSSVAFHKPPMSIFPKIDLGNGRQVDSVPQSLLAVEFEAWRKSQGEPPWLEDDKPPYLVGGQIENAFEKYRASWESWFSEIVANNRTPTATMNEWLTIVNGGREMFSIRTERIFQDPTEHSPGLGWVSPKDILHWTGRAVYNDREKYKLWCEVQLTKLDLELRGWYKGALLEEFILPEEYIDPLDPDAGESIFDLSTPLLHIPSDPEIAEAKAAGRNAYQYINIKNANGWNKVNKNLCGQFCVAALCGVDVIPFLKQWSATGLRPKTILEKDYGTVIYDLQKMLEIFNRKNEIFRPEPSVAPATPAYLEKMLRSGKKAILGVGVSHQGKVTFWGRVRHWVVLEDIVRMGNSGWLRVYNPFFNREEVYPYHLLFEYTASTSLGLWVED